MHGSAGFGAWEGRHKELLREAEQARLGRVVRGRRGRHARKESKVKVPAGIEVRWGMLEDEENVADLLQLNGMPRWVAFEERFIVAEKDGEILAALRYRTEPKRLLLGLLVSDPWASEASLAVALYGSAGLLAREMGVSEVIARPCPRADHPAQAGYRRRGRREWRLDASRSAEARDGSEVGGWRRLFRLFGVTGVPFFRAFSPRR